RPTPGAAYIVSIMSLTRVSISDVSASTAAAFSWSEPAPYLRMGLITTSLNAEIAEIAENKLLGKTVHYPLESISDQCTRMKVDEQTHMAPPKPKVRKELNGMHTFESLDGLDFEYYGLLD